MGCLLCLWPRKRLVAGDPLCLSDVQLYSRIGGDHELLGHEFLRWIGRNGGLGRSGLGLCEMRGQHGAAEGEGAAAERLTSRDEHDLPPCFVDRVPVRGQPEVAPGSPGEPHFTRSGHQQRERSRHRGIVSGLGEYICNKRYAPIKMLGIRRLRSPAVDAGSSPRTSQLRPRGT